MIPESTEHDQRIMVGLFWLFGGVIGASVATEAGYSFPSSLGIGLALVPALVVGAYVLGTVALGLFQIVSGGDADA